MDTTAAPQVIEHIKESLGFTPFETRWVPQSARFVILGQMPRATGVIRVCHLDKGKVKKLAEVEKPKGFKCATFAASSIEDRHLATGDYVGNLNVWDLEDLRNPIFSTKGHDMIINCIDGCGGLGIGNGAPELVTGSRDGTVRIWDIRQPDPVLSLEPVEGEVPADCWTVAFGNSYNDAERAIAAGYDNGDIKMFDLRTMTLKWDTNVRNGVCHLQFDRKDIRANKLGVSTLESCMCLYDLRTYHPTEGYAGRKEKVTKSTLWGCHFLPQNREVFATCGGNGSISLFKYSYPEERKLKDKDGIDRGVAGTFEMLNQKEMSTQPCISFDWHMNKTGLCVFACLDQTCRVAICTKLHLY
jgi:WD40 repeat protein